MRPRKNSSAAFDAKVEQQHAVHPNLTNQGRARLLKGAADVLGAELARCRTDGRRNGAATVLRAKIGEYDAGGYSLGGAVGEAGLLPSVRR